MGCEQKKTWEEMADLERLQEVNKRLRTEVVYLKKLEKWFQEDFDQIYFLKRLVQLAQLTTIT